MWVIYIESCLPCNTRGIMIQEFKPEQDVINLMKTKLGGMYCLQENVHEIGLNELVELEERVR